MVVIAKAPRYKTVARFTKTYNPSQKTAKIVFSVVLKRFSTNSGSYKSFLYKNGQKVLSHDDQGQGCHPLVCRNGQSMAKPEPDIPTNCSAEMLAAIRDDPIAHQGSDFPAKK